MENEHDLTKQNVRHYKEFVVELVQANLFLLASGGWSRAPLSSSLSLISGLPPSYT